MCNFNIMIYLFNIIRNDGEKRTAVFKTRWRIFRGVRVKELFISCEVCGMGPETVLCSDAIASLATDVSVGEIPTLLIILATLIFTNSVPLSCSDFWSDRWRESVESVCGERDGMEMVEKVGGDGRLSESEESKRGGGADDAIVGEEWGLNGNASPILGVRNFVGEEICKELFSLIPPYTAGAEPCYAGPPMSTIVEMGMGIGDVIMAAP
ncbi:hypothetical protein Tco_0721194 [Tanacetum coccineum]